MAKPDSRSAETVSPGVFINCPFDLQYQHLFEAIVFAVADCGFQPRCALEADDGSQIRIEKIFNIISECRFGIHDLSKTELDATNQLPRFNMPLELGIFLGAKRFGNTEQKRKVCLILDREKYRYQKFISDIAGQDIRSHGDDPKTAIVIVRNCVRSSSSTVSMPGGEVIAARYQVFRQELPSLCRGLRLSPDELTFVDYANIVKLWLGQNP
ncbi:MAG: hypothetical protein ACJ76Y_20470 [Thermoanaerobaculia bacterium]